MRLHEPTTICHQFRFHINVLSKSFFYSFSFLMGSTIQWPEMHFYFHLRFPGCKDSCLILGLSALGSVYREPFFESVIIKKVHVCEM